MVAKAQATCQVDSLVDVDEGAVAALMTIGRAAMYGCCRLS